MEAEKYSRPAKITRIIKIGRDARDDEHSGAVSRQVFLPGARQCK